LAKPKEIEMLDANDKAEIRKLIATEIAKALKEKAPKKETIKNRVLKNAGQREMTTDPGGFCQY
jgi:hypothetical protein